MSKVLVIVDAQYDFIEGSLPVPGALEKIHAIAEEMINYDRVIFTMDWHPRNHCSFDINGGQWPVHCLQGSQGAMIDPLLIKICKDWKINYEIYLKGSNKNIEEYGAFGLPQDSTLLQDLAYWDNQIELSIYDKYFICGFAGDYCVKYTMENMQELGLDVTLLEDCTAWIKK